MSCFDDQWREARMRQAIEVRAMRMETKCKFYPELLNVTVVPDFPEDQKLADAMTAFLRTMAPVFKDPEFDIESIHMTDEFRQWLSSLVKNEEVQHGQAEEGRQEVGQEAGRAAGEEGRQEVMLGIDGKPVSPQGTAAEGTTKPGPMPPFTPFERVNFIIHSAAVQLRQVYLEALGEEGCKGAVRQIALSETRLEECGHWAFAALDSQTVHIQPGEKP